VWIASTVRGHACRSRFARGWLQLPEVKDEALQDRVEQLVCEGGFHAVFAGDDEHLLALSAFRSRFAGSLFPYPPHDVIVSALDKSKLHDAAKAAGLLVPEVRTTPPDPQRDGRLWISKQRIYAPDLVHRHVDWSHHSDGEDGDVLYQRVVSGQLIAVVSLTGPDGQVQYIGGQQADALFPEPFGVSARAHMIPLPRSLASAVQRLISQLGWWGLAEVQFIVNDDGDAHLIDMNGRFFGSLALTAAAGINLPHAWLTLATGQPVALKPARPFARYQWLEGDLRRVFSPQSGHTTRELWRSLSYAPGAAHSIWSMTDPLPGVRHLIELGSRVGKKAVSA
jgi:hypothetical protein